MPAGCDNPCRFQEKGNWCDESGHGGMPAPAPEPIAQKRVREMTENWRRDNFDLAGNERIEQFVAEKVIDGISAGYSAEESLAAATSELRQAFPKPADEGRWRADEHVRFLEQERRQRNMGLGVRPR